MTSVSATGKEKGDVRSLVCWLLFGAAFLGAYLPVLSSLVNAWAASDDRSHGFAIIPMAAYFTWQKREALAAEEIRGRWPGLVVAVLALAVFVVARKAEMQTAVSSSLIFFLWGSVIYLFGYGIFRKCLFPLTLLFFMVPVPDQIIAALTIPLQLIVSKASVLMASAVGIPVLREGNLITLPEGSFEVVQACSGLRSIMALLTLGAAFSYWTLRSNVLRVILFLLAIPIAMAVNALRVFLLVAALYYAGIDLSHGTPHTMLGLVVFMVALGLFFLCGKGLSVCER